jgi:hypothetical protein
MTPKETFPAIARSGAATRDDKKNVSIRSSTLNREVDAIPV